MVIRTRVFGASAIGAVGRKTVPSYSASMISLIVYLSVPRSARDYSFGGSRGPNAIGNVNTWPHVGA